MYRMRIFASLLVSFLLITGALALVSAQEEVRAQTDDNYFFPPADEGFVPCGRRGEGNIVIDEPCNICHAAELGQNIINFVIRTVVPILAIIMVAWGSLEIMTARGNEQQYVSGRSKIAKVFIGVLIVLAAWVTVNYVLFTFFKEEVVGTWNSFDCSVEPKDPVEGITPVDFIVEGVEFIPEEFEGGDGVFGSQLSHSEAVNQLASVGVSYVKVCSTGSLNGIYQEVIDEIKWLKGECDCTITVTEGTGAGCHSTNSGHYQGIKIDIDDTPGVTNYIINNANRSSQNRSDGAAIYQFPGRSAIYARESTHWDIRVQ